MAPSASRWGGRLWEFQVCFHWKKKRQAEVAAGAVEKPDRGLMDGRDHGQGSLEGTFAWG